MRGRNMNLENKKIKFSKLYKNKKLFKIDEMGDANNILVSEKEPHCGNRSITYFIGYSDNDVIRPLCLMPPYF